MTPTFAALDLDHLFKLRLAVARWGEKDIAGWWNTDGMLGRHGEMALSRGMPRTHFVAQARVVFAVATDRCEKLFNPPRSMTLWSLPPAIEDALEDRIQEILDDLPAWARFFERLKTVAGSDLVETLRTLGLARDSVMTSVRTLSLGADGHSVPLPGLHRPSDEVVELLAAAFSLGGSGRLVVPYARLED
jgi:hypothetical protein